MTTSIGTPPVTLTYQVVVDGHLDNRWGTWFEGFSMTRRGDGTTCLTGSVLDQAELHGILAKVRDLGVTLLALAIVAGRTMY